MLKLSDNPPSLFPDNTPLTEIPGPWWVAHTRSRFEKAFAHDLLARGVPYFLPMIHRLTISGGRKRQLLMPLFNSYVFFAGSEEDRYTALATDRLCQVIPVRDQPRLIRELSTLQTVLTSRTHLDPYPFLAIGHRCRIARGPFQGIEGTVIRRDNLTRIVLHVSILGQGAAMEIHPDLLEPIQ